MSAIDLIPLTSETAPPICSRGGSVRSKAKKDSAVRRMSKFAKCYNCKTKFGIDCPLYEKNKDDKQMRCVWPDARGYAITFQCNILSEDTIRRCNANSLAAMEKVATEKGDLNSLRMLTETTLKVKEAFYPNVQKNLNVNMNVDSTSSILVKAVLERLGKKSVIDMEKEHEENDEDA